MVDVGAGQALVVIPGIQGRWEWMRPAVESLAQQWRVVTSSLPGERGSPPLSDEAGFDQFVRHVDDLMDAAHLSSAPICGVSFGGLVALRYAARRPARVKALILVSAPGPQWTPDPQIARYLRRPVLYSPLFLLRAPARFWPELRATFPELGARLHFCRTTLARLLSAPAKPSLVSRRARMAAGEVFIDDCTSVATPTLVVAGERDLDKVIDVNGTMEYVESIPGAQFRRFANTGHLGTISQPVQFAAIVSTFLKGLSC
jgi:3-oxoadipate enol-lactonase